MIKTHNTAAEEATPPSFQSAIKERERERERERRLGRRGEHHHVIIICGATDVVVKEGTEE
jgi:hypothetical protein